MRPFRQTKTEEDNVPAEIKEYYQADRRDRVGMAWLFSAIAFIVTVLVVLGLFFGGRWLYTSFNKRSDTPKSENADADKAPDGSVSSQNPTEMAKPGAPNNAATPPPETKPTPAPTPTPSPAPSPPDAEVPLPHTGPYEDL